MKLTQDIREQIIRKAVKHTFKQRDDIHYAAKSRLAEDVYDHVVGPHLTIVNALPAGFFIESSQVNATFDGRSRMQIWMKSTRRIPASGTGYAGNLAHFDKHHPFTQRYNELELSEKKINADKEVLTRELKNLLSRVTTAKRLIEVWPEGEQFTPVVAQPIENPPAVQAQGLNDLINRLGAPCAK